MAQLKGKFLENDTIKGTKVRLDNDQALRGRNAADTADIDLIKVDTSDVVTLPAGTQVGTSTVLVEADKASANGVASLDGGGKIPAGQLPNAVMEFQGQWDASTNTPTLSNGSGNAGDVYRVNVAGSTDFGAGSISFAVGDWVIVNSSLVHEKADNTNDVTSVAGKTGAVTLDTDDVTEAGNLYFTDARARTAAVVNSTAGSETDQAPSVDAIKTFVQNEVAGVTGFAGANEVFTLTSTNITNQFVDLAVEASHVISLDAEGVTQLQGTDYTVALTGGAGSVTRLAFAGDLATGGAAELVAGDVLQVAYDEA